MRLSSWNRFSTVFETAWKACHVRNRNHPSQRSRTLEAKDQEDDEHWTLVLSTWLQWPISMSCNMFCFTWWIKSVNSCIWKEFSNWKLISSHSNCLRPGDPGPSPLALCSLLWAAPYCTYACGFKVLACFAVWYLGVSSLEGLRWRHSLSQGKSQC